MNKFNLKTEINLVNFKGINAIIWWCGEHVLQADGRWLATCHPYLLLPFFTPFHPLSPPLTTCVPPKLFPLARQTLDARKKSRNVSSLMSNTLKIMSNCNSSASVNCQHVSSSSSRGVGVEGVEPKSYPAAIGLDVSNESVYQFALNWCCWMILKRSTWI